MGNDNCATASNILTQIALVIIISQYASDFDDR